MYKINKYIIKEINKFIIIKIIKNKYKILNKLINIINNKFKLIKNKFLNSRLCNFITN
jgi:hypothetical protein